MQRITTPLPALESITYDVLTAVSGGCRPKPAPAPAQVTNVQNVQNVQYVQAPVAVPVPYYVGVPQQPASVESTVEIGYGSTTATG